MVLREIQLYLNRNNPAREVKAELSPDVAMHLLNSQRKYLLRLEQDFSVKIDIVVNPDLKRGQVKMINYGQGR
jgi:Ribonuclease G/E